MRAQKVESTLYGATLKALLSHSVPEVSVKEANQAQTALFLDAREPREFDVSHIANAIPVGYDNLDLSALDNVDKNTKIIVYCSVGYRSEKVAEKLLAEGFKDVSNLYGGIFEWKNQGFPVINTQGKTDSVHAYSKTWGIWLNKGEKVYK